MKPKKSIANVSGVILIIAALFLMKTPAYTSIKTWVVDSGGSILMAVGVAMGMIALTFTTGVLLIRKKQQNIEY